MAIASSEHSEDILESLDDTESPSKTSASASPPEERDPTDVPSPAHIDPVLSLELRLRWLEALLLGAPRQESRDRKGGRDRPSERKHTQPGNESLIQLAGNVQRRLNAVVESNDGLKKFMHQCTRLLSLFRPCHPAAWRRVRVQTAALLTPSARR